MAPTTITSFLNRPVYLIAEIGSNWRMGCPSRDLQMARCLIEKAADAGADAVKFQRFRAESIYAFGSGPCAHLVEKGIQEEIGDVFRDLELPDGFLPQLHELCDKRGVAFMASTFSARDFCAIDPYVTIHKVASPELHDPELLELVARSGKPALLSTGGSSEEEVAWALDRWREYGGKEFAVLQCTLQYPTDPAEAHLRVLPTLAKRFGCPVGLSDHTANPLVAPTAAVALGARIIEKHMTLHRDLVGPDHSWAITGEEFKEMVHAIRLTEQMLGSPQKKICAAEEPLRRFSRRSVQLTQDVKLGEKLERGVNYAVLRPGTKTQGIHAREMGVLEGARAAKAMQRGCGIQVGDWICDA